MLFRKKCLHQFNNYIEIKLASYKALGFLSPQNNNHANCVIIYLRTLYIIIVHTITVQCGGGGVVFSYIYIYLLLYFKIIYILLLIVIYTYI